MGATSHDLHIDQVLSNMALGYRPEGFIADMIFPIVPVAKQSDLYTIFSRADRLRNEDTKRAPGTRAKQVHESVSSASFYCPNYALSAPVTLEDRENADPIFLNSIINGRTQLILDKLLLDWEIRVASMVTSTTNVGSSAAVASAWNGSGDPLGDMNTALDNVQYANGVRPNRIVMGLEAWQAFRRDSNVRDLIFGSNNGGGYPSLEQVRNLLAVDNLQIGGAFQNTGQEGLAESLSTIWGDNVLAYYAPPAPTKERPSFGYTFRWQKPGVPQMQVERHPYDSRTKSEDVEAGYYQTEKVTGASYGFLLTAVNSST